MSYDHKAIAQKYAQIWQNERVYEPDLKQATRPYYNLMMFPYPSAEGLHVGNMYAFTGADVHGRFRRRLGYDVFEPIGLDGFGIHSENFAIKMGRHPAEQAKLSEDNFYRQLSLIGNGFSWENRLETYDSEYYVWTQWLLTQMFKRGLAFKSEAMVNWCPKDKTVLADEQVEDGVCERCKTPVERRSMSSWYLRITDYADRLLDNIDQFVWRDADGKDRRGLDWPSKVTTAQKNWIGRNPGLDIDFALENNSNKLTIWTTYWETLFGATFLVLAPEHPLALEIAEDGQKAEVESYIKTSLNRSEQDRKAGAEKTGVFTGAYAINPATKQRVPVWVADYVLTSVGTGAVMGVPAHDDRDLAFAQKYDLPVVVVIDENGELTSSGAFNGESAVGLGKRAMMKWMIDEGFARERINYHLRDWLISRQRYWGPPIPLIFCQACADKQRGERSDMPGWWSVPEKDLPVLLPQIEDYTPKGDGTSPLENAPDSWKSVVCPDCGSRAKRETDVSDTFLDSSWYFLRYPSVKDNSGPFPHVRSTQEIGKPAWFPVDAYIGGAEHAVLHLLYARFVTMALYDWGLLPVEEPFPFLFGHGLIIKDGAKMSKSRGNVVNPDEYIEKYGADALRAYLMFLGPYDQGGDFRDTGMSGMYKWLAKVWSMFAQPAGEGETSPDLKRALHRTIAANTKDLYQLKYNTCLARLMEIVNLWRGGKNLAHSERIVFLQLLAPFAPYLAEDLYQQIARVGETQFKSIHRSGWPEADQSLLEAEVVNMAIQVNGRLRGSMAVNPSEAGDEASLVERAKKMESVARHLTSEPRKVIVISGKIINFVL